MQRRPETGAWTLTLLAAVILAGCAPEPSVRAQPDPEAPLTVEVRAEPVLLDPNDPERREVGRLVYRAGFHLTAEHPDFGGFSGLEVDAGGGMTAVSDRGHWLTAELLHDAGGTLTGIAPARLGPLLDDDGEPVSGRWRRDAEELAALPEGFAVSFEGDHRLVLYRGSEGTPPQGPPEPLAVPEGIAAAGDNEGLEAVTRLADGRLLILTEGLRNGDGVAGWVGHPEDGWQRLTYVLRDERQPTGAATLPGGDVLVLERSYTKAAGNRLRITRLAGEALLGGARLAGEELMLLERPLTVDNLEGIAVRQGPRGEALIYLLADDNFGDDQRTLLLQLELPAEEP